MNLVMGGEGLVIKNVIKKILIIIIMEELKTGIRCRNH